MGEKEEEEVYVILPLGHDRCKAQPRLTPEKIQIVSGHLQGMMYNTQFGITNSP